ncbi:hypothetical protein ACIBPB_06315 [Micromonospora sp. NPDC049836]|uniref:hypothetical protein n=1 Tax=Micromonospora sp. NPDC049836 TaxID=3364274 RepID=UPI00378BE10A
MSAGRTGVRAGLVALGLALPGLISASGTPGRAAPGTAPVAAVEAAAGPGGTVNGIPAQELARMRREAPLVEAALRIQRAAGDGTAAGFAGVALTGAGDGVDVFWKGAPPGAVRREIAAVRTGRVTVRAARYSRAELASAAATVARADGTVTVSYPVSGTALVVASPDPAATRARLPRLPVEVTLTRAAAAPKPAAAKPAGSKAAGSKSAGSKSARSKAAGTATAAATMVAAAETLPSPSRQDDARPAWGGAHLINRNAAGGNSGWQTRDATGKVIDADTAYHCTSGFPVRNPLTAVEYLLVPASCGKPRDLFVKPNGVAVNDVLAGDNTLVSAVPGVMLTRPAGGAEPFLYTGGSWSDTGWSIERAAPLVAGQHVCVTGAQTGLACGAQVSDTLGNRSGWTPNSTGGSTVLSGLTRVLLAEHSWYTLRDGTTCTISPAPEDVGCLPYQGPGDVGATVFTVDGGTTTGVTIRGLVMRMEFPQDDGLENVQFVDVGDVMPMLRGFENSFGTWLELVTKFNDTP